MVLLPLEVLSLNCEEYHWLWTRWYSSQWRFWAPRLGGVSLPTNDSIYRVSRPRYMLSSTCQIRWHSSQWRFLAPRLGGVLFITNNSIYRDIGICYLPLSNRVVLLLSKLTVQAASALKDHIRGAHLPHPVLKYCQAYQVSHVFHQFSITNLVLYMETGRLYMEPFFKHRPPFCTRLSLLNYQLQIYYRKRTLLVI